MPCYYFQLREGHGGISDPEPCDLPDDQAALAYAWTVATEVMKNRERETRHWRLGIRREQEADCFTELQFAATDRTLNHLTGNLRRLVENNSSKRLSLQEAIYAARRTVRRSRALVSRSRGKPYLVSDEWGRDSTL